MITVKVASQAHHQHGERCTSCQTMACAPRASSDEPAPPERRGAGGPALAADIETPENNLNAPSKKNMQASGANPKNRRTLAKPLRSIAIFGAVGAMVTAIALPAFAAVKPGDAAPATLQQMAAEDAQSIVVASEATVAPMERGTFTATTPEEIEKAKAEAAAAARATAAASSSGVSLAGIDLNMVAPGSGEVRYPLAGGSYTSGEGPGSGRGHQGWDMLAPEGTPIFAVASGVVRISSEGYYGYGVGIVIDHAIGGQSVSSLYGHMVYGSRLVSAGDYVNAGQMIGLVGNTGQSYGAHLHLEIRVGNGIVDPESWLAANAG